MEYSDSRGSLVLPHSSPELNEDEEEEESRYHEYHDDFERSMRSNSQESYNQEPPSKRYKPCKVDRLSNLPNSLITHIVSFLPVKYAVMTGLLSKLWRHTWTSSPSLSFNGYIVSPGLISTALMLHKGPVIKKLSLTGIYGVDPQLNLWVQSAAIKRVEELDIEINNHTDSYWLPPSLLSCDTLREFSLGVNQIEYGSSIHWKSLKKLSLKSITNLTDDMIRNILDGSPMLDSLSLKRCHGFGRVIVGSSSKLRTLVINLDSPIDENEDNDSDDWLEVSGPSITSLEISGYLDEKHFRVKDVSSLVELTIRFTMSSLLGWDRENGDWDEGSSDDASMAKLQKRQWMLLDLLRKVHHVQKLSIGTWCTQILSMCKLRKMPVVYLKCKSLELCRLHERSIPGVARLLQSALFLERLTIYMSPIHRDDEQAEDLNEFVDFDGENYWKSQEKGFEYSLMRHLKILWFIGFADIGAKGASFMAEFAEFVLEHAKILEKLEFKPGESVYKDYRLSDLRKSSLFPVIQKLLSYPRSSQFARVLLS